RTASCTASGLRSASTTVAPSRAKVSAVARPMPWAAPVMRQILLSRRGMVVACAGSSVVGLEAAQRFACRAVEQEAPAEAAGQRVATPFEGLDPLAIDELQRAAGPSRKADAEDGADVGVVGAAEHAFGQAAGGLHRLAVEQAVLHVLQVPGELGVF